VTANIEGELEKRIAEMEEVEKKRIEEHEKKVTEEETQRAGEEKNKTLFSGGGGLPKYQDLFKAQTTVGVSTNNQVPIIKQTTSNGIGSGVLPPLPKKDVVNPFGPKPVPQPDLTKVKPLNQPIQPNKPIKQEENKIDRGKVKVEVEEPEQDVRSKIQDSRIATEKQEEYNKVY